MKNLYVAIAVALMGFAPAISRGQAPAPVGRLVSIAGGQKIHLHCVGSGSPTVVFEGGSGDFSVIWSLVQSRVSRVTRACSYDRAGFAWSDPGNRPRTFSQMALELHETLTSAKIPGPYVLVGQSFGGSLVRGFANRYAKSVAGMVLVDAIHEDGYVVWGGQPHHLRDEAQGRVEPKPILGLDTATIRMSRTTQGGEEQPIHPPLDRMPVVDQRTWRWAASQPVYSLVQPLEMEWSAEEAEREYQRRLVERAPLGAIPLIVLARTHGGFASGMSISADSLEKIRRAQQADLAKLSRNGELRFAPNAGHNIHVEDPGFVAQAILDVVRMVRARTHGH